VARTGSPLLKTVRAIRARLEGRAGPVKTVPSGLESFDKLTGGFRPGTLVLLAGWPCLGKTTLALNILHHLACHRRVTVGMISHSDREQLVGLLACLGAGVDPRQFRSGRLGAAEKRRLLKDGLRTLEKAPIHLEDDQDAEVKAWARSTALGHGARLIVVDKLPLFLEGQDPSKEAPAFCRRLRAMARETGLVVLLLCDLEGKGHPGRPGLGDLRSLGPVARQADMVIFLHSDGIFSDPPDLGAPWFLCVQKNRHGVTGEALVRRDGCRFG